MEQWNFEANTELDPFAIPPLSHKIASWKCIKNHEWKCSIEKRVGIDRGACPICLMEREQEQEMTMIEDFLLSDDETEKGKH
jgi:hypothetical protein